VGILFTKRPVEPRIDPDAVELALDLTAEAVTLYERPLHGAWKKFASAPLDDPEFPIVIGLLRTEAESHAGGHRPVRIWLPGEQVLKQRERIDGATSAARRQATFDYIDRETVYRPDDVAVAIGPPDQNGETTLLITFAETWHEARDYAIRWGFIPGDVSTRHNAGEFGSEGPVFQLHSTPPEPSTPARRNRLAIAALALSVIAAGSAAWTVRPWETRSGPAVMAPGGAVEVAEAPPIVQPPLPVSKPVAADPMQAPGPETHAEAIHPEGSVPPEHFPRNLVLSPPSGTARPPTIAPSLTAFDIPPVPEALTTPAGIGPAPLPLPDPEPASLRRDPVAAQIGPVPEMQPREISAPLAVKENYHAMEPLVRIEKVTLLSHGKTPPQKAPASPSAGPPPAEPITTAEDASAASESAVAPLNVPAPVSAPRPARADPVDRGAAIVETNPTPKVVPPPRPARSGEPETNTETRPEPLAPPVTTSDLPAGAMPVAPPTTFASLTSPLPRIRPARRAAPRALPPVTTLPAITGSPQRSTRAAASEQGLPLDRTALIGILDLDTGRKALLRLPDGRYRSVIVGDVLDGWRVAIIGPDAMRFTRGGEDLTLLLVNR
jgi:hypothetical protein